MEELKVGDRILYDRNTVHTVDEIDGNKITFKIDNGLYMDSSDWYFDHDKVEKLPEDLAKLPSGFGYNGEYFNLEIYKDEQNRFISYYRNHPDKYTMSVKDALELYEETKKQKKLD